MTILVKKVFISSKPTFVYLLCPPLCGPFSIQESAAGGLSYKVKKGGDFVKYIWQISPLLDGSFLIINGTGCIYVLLTFRLWLLPVR